MARRVITTRITRMLKQKARLAFLWGGTEILLRQGFTIVVTITLARLLAPEVFGTLALLHLFAGMAFVFVDGGLSAALVQSEKINHTDESTVFWFNLLMAVVLGSVFCAVAPVVAAFYAQPVLATLVMLLALNIVLSALGSIHTALLSRHLEFGVQMKIGVAASVLSGAVAVFMAWAGYGVWALAAQVLVATALSTMLLWGLHAWRPSLAFSMASLRRLFAFGGYVMLAGMLDMLYSRLNSLLVGKVHGVRDLGFYSRAEGARDMPMGAMGNLIASVAFPVFSVAAGDVAGLRKGLRFAVRSMMLLNVPMMLGLYAVTEPLILALFGEAWRPAAPILKVMCLAGLFFPLHLLNVQALKAQGMSSLFFRLEVFSKALGCLFLVVGIFFGVMGIVWSTVAFALVSFVVHAWYTGRILGYGASEQVKDVMPVLLCAVPMTLLVGLLEGGWHSAPALLELFGLVCLGVTIFLLLAWVFRLPHLNETMKWLRLRQAKEGMA